MDVSTLKTITYNGAAIEKLYYNNVLVWQKQSVTPPGEILKIVLFQSSDDPLYISTNEILDIFTQNTGNKFSFQLEDGATFGTERDVIDFLIASLETIQFSWSRLELFNEYAGDYEILQLPFFVPSREALRDYLDDTLGREMRGVIEGVGVGLQFLAMYPGEQYVVASSKELSSLADFYGMKLAYPSGNALWENIVAGFGAAPVHVSTEDLNYAMMVGLVDGVICRYDTFVKEDLFEYGIYLYKLQAWDVQSFVANASSMGKFNTTQKDEFCDALNNGISIYYDVSEQAWMEREEQIVASGVTIYEFDSVQVEDIRTALEAIYLQYQQSYPNWYGTVDDFMNGYR